MSTRKIEAVKRPVNPGVAFAPGCTLCPRLAQFLHDVRAKHPHYHAAPVPPFGPPKGPLLIVGLAPGMHGANATGRPFTGDHAGRLLFETLHRFGFANQVGTGNPDDGLVLHGCRITNAVKCLPPGNKPVGAEVAMCNPFLQHDIAQLERPGVILALGGVAHKAVLKALGYAQSAAKFAHGAEFALDDGLTLVSSYHCSRYNTQTKRLTPAMFDDIFRTLQQRMRR